MCDPPSPGVPALLRGGKDVDLDLNFFYTLFLVREPQLLQYFSASYAPLLLFRPWLLLTFNLKTPARGRGGTEEIGRSALY